MSFALGLCIFIAGGRIASAQSTDVTFRADARLVQTSVSVVNIPTGEPVAGLERKDFAIRDNGTVRTPTIFLAGDQLPPLNVMILVESAGAQVKAVDELIDTLPRAVENLRPQDAVGIASVFPGHKVFLEPTVDRAALPGALRRVQASQRAYMDASSVGDKKSRPKFSFDDLSRALVALSNQYSDPVAKSRFVVVIVTDDFDLLSPGSSAAAAKSLLRDGTTIAAFVDNQNPGIAIANKLFHTVRFGTPLRLAYRDRGASYFAQQTGGPVVTVRDGGYVEAVRSLLRTFSSSYLIGFQPSERDRDGKYHKLSISVKRPDLQGKIRILSRQGYWAVR
jgi:VWFA-related protein